MKRKNFNFSGSNLGREVPDYEKLHCLKQTLNLPWLLQAHFKTVNRDIIDAFARGAQHTVTKTQYKTLCEEIHLLKKLLKRAIEADDFELVKSVFNHPLVKMHTIITNRSLAMKMKPYYQYDFIPDERTLDNLKMSIQEMLLQIKV